MACKSKKKMEDGGLFGSMAQGALSGAQYGPIGIAAGIGVGAITNSLARKNELENMLAAREAHTNYMKQQSAYSQAQQQGIPTSLNNIPLMAYGGMSGETVELERGEPYMLPNGQIDNVSTNAPTHAQGGVTMNMPGGTKVLGKMESEYGKQYKELGRKLSKAQSKYDTVLKENPTGIATKTAKRMLANIQKEFDNLFVSQEQQKTEMNQNPIMANGGTVTPPKEYTYEDYKNAYQGFNTDSFTYSDEQIRSAKEGELISQRPLYTPGTRDVLGYEQTIKGTGKIYTPIKKVEGKSGGIAKPVEYTPMPESKSVDFTGPQGLKKSREYYSGVEGSPNKLGAEFTIPQEEFRQAKTGDVVSQYKLYDKDGKVVGFEQLIKGEGKKYVSPKEAGYKPEQFARGGLTREKNYGSSKKPYPSVSSSDFAGGGRSYPIPTKADAIDALRLAGLHGRSDVKAKVYEKYPSLRKGQDGLMTGYANPISGYLEPTVAPEGLSNSYISQFNQSALNTPQNANTGMLSNLGGLASNLGGLSGIANTTATLAPTLYNLYQGSQGGTQLNAEDYYNPNTGQIESIMANRRYNIDPQLESNRLAEATYYRNLREGAPSQAQYLAGLNIGQINRQRADAAAYAQQQNVNNQYLAEQAQTLGQLGQQQAQMDYGIDRFNLQSTAAAQNMTATGLGQLSQYAQTNKLMGGQQAADQQRMNLLNDFVRNYEFNNGRWIFKQTGQPADATTVQNIMNVLNQ